MLKPKRITLGIVLIASLLSCSTTNRENNTISADTKDFKTFDTAIYFSGFFVNEKYINDLKENKSPRHALLDINESYTFIPKRTLLKTLMIYSFHQGGGEFVIIKNGNKYQMYEDGEKEPLQDIEVIANNKIKIGKNVFVKSNENVLEEELFKGKYKTMEGNNVEFTIDGKVVGLDTFKLYYPTIDYGGGPGMDVDFIYLARTDEQRPRGEYCYKFNKDTLLIYKTICLGYDTVNQMCFKTDYGALAYKLIKLN